MVGMEKSEFQARAPVVCTCMQLRKASRQVTALYDRHLEPHGVTVTQYGTLGMIRAFDGAGIGDLAEKLLTDPTTLTRNLRPLVRRGYVVLAENPRDKRNRNLHLTESGRNALRAARPGWEAAQREIAKVLGPKDGSALAGSIDRMLDKLTPQASK